MAKSQNDLIYDDGSLAYLRERVTRLTVCSAQPSSYSDANSTTGVMLAKSGVLTSASFTLADGDTDGRKITLAAQNGISISKSGTMNHGAWIGSTGSTLLAVTTITSASLTAGDAVNVPAHTFEIGDVGFVPTQISGLLAWYDFSDVSTLWQDSARTTPVTADGDPIGAVDDKSGNGRHLLQASSALKPTYKTGIQNGKSVGRLDGGDWLEDSSGFSISQPHMTFVVAVDTLGTNGTRYLLSGQLSARYEFLHISTDDYRIGFGTSLAGGAMDTNWHLWTGLANTTASELWVDQVSTLTGNAGDQTGSGYMIGANQLGNSRWQGDVGEVFLYSPNPSSGDQASAESYMLTKWGI